MDAQKQNLAGAAPENPNPSTDTGKATPETIVIDQATKDRLADIRARDAAQVQIANPQAESRQHRSNNVR